jgi:hypothetical protein
MTVSTFSAEKTNADSETIKELRKKIISSVAKDLLRDTSPDPVIDALFVSLPSNVDFRRPNPKDDQTRIPAQGLTEEMATLLSNNKPKTIEEAIITLRENRLIPNTNFVLPTPEQMANDKDTKAQHEKDCRTVQGVCEALTAYANQTQNKKPILSERTIEKAVGTLSFIESNGKPITADLSSLQNGDVSNELRNSIVRTVEKVLEQQKKPAPNQAVETVHKGVVGVRGLELAGAYMRQ